MSRRTAAVAGLISIAAYVALAALSGHLSPLARGPLLDGIGPPQAYRWVSPPPDLASGNQPPSSGVFHVPLDPNGSRPEVFVTSDNQATVVVPKDAFDGKPGQIEVTLKVDPLDPATLTSPGKHLTIFGNAYRMQATYQPSGDEAPLALPLDGSSSIPRRQACTRPSTSSTRRPTGRPWTAQEDPTRLRNNRPKGRFRRSAT